MQFCNCFIVHVFFEVRQTQVMMREMTQPTEACVEVVREYIRPVADVLVGILLELLPPGQSHEAMYATGFSIMGQILFYKQCRPVARLLIPARVWLHVGNFCVGAVCLALSSHLFDEDDYWNDHGDFRKAVRPSVD